MKSTHRVNIIPFLGCQIQAICWFINGRSSDDVNSTYSPEVGWAPEVCRGAWLPSTKTNVSDFLQINLGYEFYICAIATQGKLTAVQGTTKYMIRTSLDNVTWTTYKENGTEKVCNFPFCECCAACSIQCALKKRSKIKKAISKSCRDCQKPGKSSSSSSLPPGFCIVNGKKYFEEIHLLFSPIFTPIA